MFDCMLSMRIIKFLLADLKASITRLDKDQCQKPKWSRTNSSFQCLKLLNNFYI